MSDRRPGTSKKAQIAYRRQKVSEMYLRGEYQTVIAESLEVAQATISRDLAALQKEWLNSALVNIDEKRAEELAKVDALEREYWDAWNNSKENAEKEVVKARGTSETPGSFEKTKYTEGQSGNPAFLTGVQWCINKRCELLGLDAPKQQSGEVTLRIIRESGTDRKTS